LHFGGHKGLGLFRAVQIVALEVPRSIRGGGTIASNQSAEKFRADRRVAVARLPEVLIPKPGTPSQDSRRSMFCDGIGVTASADDLESPQSRLSAARECAAVPHAQARRPG
jgi:hypothetical protein